MSEGEAGKGTGQVPVALLEHVDEFLDLVIMLQVLLQLYQLLRESLDTRLQTCKTKAGDSVSVGYMLQWGSGGQEMGTLAGTGWLWDGMDGLWARKGGLWLERVGCAQRSTEHSTAPLPYASTYSHPSGDPTTDVCWTPVEGSYSLQQTPPGLWVPKQEVKPYGEGL